MVVFCLYQYNFFGGEEQLFFNMMMGRICFVVLIVYCSIGLVCGFIMFWCFIYIIWYFRFSFCYYYIEIGIIWRRVLGNGCVIYYFDY